MWQKHKLDLNNPVTDVKILLCLNYIITFPEMKKKILKTTIPYGI